MRSAFIALAVALAPAGCEAERRAAPAPERAMAPADYDAWRRPELLVSALALRPGDAVADVGAGDGYFTGRLAAAVGPAGRVVATDVDPAALARIDAAAPIETRRVRPDDPGLEPGAYQLVLMAQVDHLVPDRAAYLARLRAALAPGGRVAVSNRLSHRAALERAAGAAGYVVTYAGLDLPGQYLALLVPEAPR